MKFGVGFFSLQRPPGFARTHADLYADLIAQSQLADSRGLDSLWLCEHHFFEDGFINALMPTSAAMLAATKRISVGADVVYSLYNPLRLAEDAIACDLIGRGRFILGLAATYLDFELAAFGLTKEHEAARLGEMLSILRGAFSNKPFSFSGANYSVPSVTVTPPPYTAGGPKIVLGSHGDPRKEMERAVKAGDHYRTNPVWPFEEVVSLARDFAALRTEPEAEIFVYNYGFLSEQRDPWEIMEPGYRYIRQTYDKVAGGVVPEHIRSAASAVAASRQAVLDKSKFRTVLGNRQQFRAEVERYAEAIGDRMHFVLRLGYPGLEPALVSEAIELYAEVAKGFR